MKKLPTEIWEKIFIQLDLEERIKCMLVCRKWWRVLDEYSLLYNVTIDNNKEKLTRFIAMIKAFPHRAAQVQEFIVIDSTVCGFNKRELCHLLPNARVIKLGWYSESIDSADPFAEPITMVHSNSKIEVIEDKVRCEFASQMLTSNLCSHLRELDLALSTDPDTKRVILTQIRNLPVLQKLSLTSIKIGVKDLEVIHRNIPSIRDLYLKSVFVKDSEMPSNIVPVAALRNFYINICGTGNNATVHSQFYQYMTAKYKNVTNIDCVDPALTRSNSDDLEQIYQNGILDFLRMIGQKQNRLTICHMPDNLDIFAELDAVDAEIEELKIFDCFNDDLFYHLGRSKQSKFVRKLDIHDSYFDFEFGESITTMTSLHTVNISNDVKYDYDDGPVLNLVDCLNAFPESVTQFSISGYSLETNQIGIRQSQIETLDISCTYLNQSLAKTISSCFPKLKELTLSGSVEENIDITLNHPHLKRVKITTTNWDDCAFLFTCGSRTEYYLCHRDNKWMKVEVRQASFSEIETLSVLSISTFTVKKLDFSNGIIEIRS